MLHKTPHNYTAPLAADPPANPSLPHAGLVSQGPGHASTHWGPCSAAAKIAGASV